MAMDRAKVLMVALTVDGTDVGETYSGFQMIQALGRQADVTLLCLDRPGRTPTAKQLPHVRVIAFPEPPLFNRFERLRAQMKPHWPLFSRHAQRWITQSLANGERFDVAHQILPQAMRHRSPLRHFPIPYVIGPLGGSLPTPSGMAAEVQSDTPLVRLRTLDSLRLRLDQPLRASYERAALVLGVAPYVAEILGDLRLQRFEVALERAGDAVSGPTWMPPAPGELKMLHVGRTIRTKGLRDMIRALAHLSDLPGVTLTSAGDGPDLEACRAEARALGVDDRINFLGRVSRDTVEHLYASHHLFAFPTFREPMGGVFFEAMRWGLPVLTADYGGPQAIVDDNSGIRVKVTHPAQYAADLAAAVRALIDDPSRLAALARGARARMQSLGSWDDKASDMLALYRSIYARSA
jgi:glycosyltransferase involved in cell wall biosynthesis